MIRLALVALSLLASMAGRAAMAADQGRILCAYWRELPGTLVSDLTSARTYPLFPSEQTYLEKLEIPENQEGNYGTVLRGFVLPPTTGEYTFFIASTNQSELWLSPTDRPDEQVIVAKVSGWCAARDWMASPEQQSKPIRLDGGGRYYLEVRHKNGGGDNHLSVAWKPPDGTLEGPIPGNRLAPAQPVEVPAPRASLAEVPVAPGEHMLQVNVDYLTQQVTVRVKVVLPAGFQKGARSPAIVFLADVDLERDPESAGNRPDKLMPAAYAQAKQVVTVWPGCPEGRSYEQQVTIQAMAAATKAVCDAYSLDVAHLGLSGAGGGGSACWRLALAMPGKFAAVAPVDGLEVNDPRLREALRGTRVRMYTDIDQGFATGRANEMAKLLDGLDPKPEIIYLGEKELGGKRAAAYCYARSEFYDEVLGLKPPPQVAPAGVRWRLPVLVIGGAVVAIGVVWAVLRSRRAGQAV